MNNYTCEGDLRDDMPANWWLGSSNCFYLLAALVHRNNPDIVSDPTDAPPGGTRDAIRKQVTDDRAKEVVASKSAAGTNRSQIEENMMTTKAALMAQNIDLQQTEGIKEQLNLMKEFRSSFVNVSNTPGGTATGEKEFDEAVYDMLCELPFMKKRKANNNGGST